MNVECLMDFLLQNLIKKISFSPSNSDSLTNIETKSNLPYIHSPAFPEIT